jgi:hypothetical protein
LPYRFHPPQPVRSATDAEYVHAIQAGEALQSRLFFNTLDADIESAGHGGGFVVKEKLTGLPVDAQREFAGAASDDDDVMALIFNPVVVPSFFVIVADCRIGS